MYEIAPVLAALDANRWRVLALCGLAMACNYTWFFAAVRQASETASCRCPYFAFSSGSSPMPRWCSATNSGSTRSIIGT